VKAHARPALSDFNLLARLGLLVAKRRSRGVFQTSMERGTEEPSRIEEARVDGRSEARSSILVSSDHESRGIYAYRRGCDSDEALRDNNVVRCIELLE